MELGWNKALDAAEHADPAVRAREESELRWWLEKARPALIRVTSAAASTVVPGPGGISRRGGRAP